MKRSVEFSQLFAFSGVLILIAFGISMWSGYPKGVGDISIKPVLQGSFLGAVLFMLMVFVGRYLHIYVPSYRDLVLELRQLFSELSWSNIIVLSVMAGVSEELLFRGVIQSYLMSITSPLIAVIISASLFGVMHCYSRLYIVVTLIFGLFIGWLYYESQSLLLIVTLHAVYDVLAFASIVKYPHILGLDKHKK